MKKKYTTVWADKADFNNVKRTRDTGNEQRQVKCFGPVHCGAGCVTPDVMSNL